MSANQFSPEAYSFVRVPGALLLGIALLATGCSIYADLCEAMIGCEGGTDYTIESCEIKMETSEDVAAAYGCEAEWDAVVVCMKDTGHCSFGGKDTRRYESRCVDAKKRWAACQPHNRMNW